MEIYGYAGKILRVDLTSGSIKTEDLDLDMARKYVGAQGINTRLFYESTKPDVDPLGPENVVVIGAGALSGTSTPSSTKVSATTRFPLNGAIGTAVGCGFGPMLKWAGYDNIVITGASTKPVYLLILDDEVQLCDASNLWGKDTYEATDALHDRHGGDSNVICIGQAGENLVKISLAFIEKIAHIGRGGLAAVFGSKKLKAIVVRGTKGIKIANPEMFQSLYDSVVKYALTDRNRPVWIKYGLQGILETWFKAGTVQIHNKRETPDPEKAIAAYGMKAFDDTIEMIPWAGPSCITCDKAFMKVKKGEFEGLVTTSAAPSVAGAFIGSGFNMDLGTAMKGFDMLQRYGIDVIDGPYLIELIIELYNNGLVSSDLLGMEPRHDYTTFVEAIEKINRREGFWGTVADGVLAVIGAVKGADKYAIHGKGLSSGFDPRIAFGVESFSDNFMNPRGAQSFGLVKAPSTAIPGMHISKIREIAESYQIPPEAMKRIFSDDEWNVSRLTPYVQNANTGYNCLGLCYRFFIGRQHNPVRVAAFYHAVTGIPMTPEDFMTAADRVFNIQKALNAREGFDRKDDRFPERFLTEPVKHAGKEIYLENYYRTHRITAEGSEKMLDEYYNERGWDVKTGNPGKAKLTQLGLEDVAEDLEKRGCLSE